MRVNGFSLIEVLIVISVIALINIIMLPNFNSLMSSAKTVSAKSNTRNLMVAIEQYYFLHQEYPNGLNGSISMLIDTLKNNNILPSSPNNPFTGAVYSDSDLSGKLIYEFVSPNEYRLTLYGVKNSSIIFEYP